MGQWQNILHLYFDAFMLRNWQVIAYHNVARSSGVIMGGNAICISCTPDAALQHVSLINAAFNQFTLDLDTVVNAEEDFELFRWGSHLEFRRSNVLSTKEDTGVTAQQDAVGRVDNSGSQVNILF